MFFSLKVQTARTRPIHKIPFTSEHRPTLNHFLFRDSLWAGNAGLNGCFVLSLYWYKHSTQYIVVLIFVFCVYSTQGKKDDLIDPEADEPKVKSVPLLHVDSTSASHTLKKRSKV